MTKRKLFSIAILLVGVHSILLGIFIYFNTTFFYQFFFNTEITNPFFVKQSGLFLFLLGLYYLLPLINIERLGEIAIVTIVTKMLAVVFLIINATLTPNSQLMYLAALGDGIMGLTVGISYWNYRKVIKSANHQD